MKSEINLLDVVALTEDLPEYNLSRGRVGTVVEVLSNGQAFESLSLRPNQIMVLHYEPFRTRPASEIVATRQLEIRMRRES